nr:hypothetical protein [Tanacetum cinerariifolium]
MRKLKSVQQRCHILSPLEELRPQSSGRGICHWCRIWEKMRVLLLHLVFTLPGELRTSPVVPAHFDDQNMTLLQTLDLTVHDLDGFFYEVQFVVNLDFIQCLDTALDLNYLLGCLMDDLWASELSISNLSPSDR